MTITESLLITMDSDREAYGACLAIAQEATTGHHPEVAAAMLER